MSKVYAPGEKTHKDENFPVASFLIDKPYRKPVLAYYRFARASDDIADHPDLSEAEKIEGLNAFEATLLGHDDKVADALPLREALAEYKLSPRHALDLLVAFRQDARKARYASWDELMHYCAYSAAPVGRFVLEVHGESETTWPASDALCSALQIVNHLQDCKADYQRLNRVYLPQDTLPRYGVTEAALAAPASSDGLRDALKELTLKTGSLLGERLSPQVKNGRLSLEVAVIELLANRLLHVLLRRDPLSQRVHLHKIRLIPIVLEAAFRNTTGRWLKRT